MSNEKSKTGAAKGGITSLEGLTRYVLCTDGEMRPVSNSAQRISGEFYYVTDVQRLLASTAGEQAEPLSDERIIDLAQLEGDETSHGFIFNKDSGFSVISFARAIEREVRAVPSAAPPAGLDERERFIWQMGYNAAAPAAPEQVQAEAPYGYWHEGEWYGYCPDENAVNFEIGDIVELTPVWTHGKAVSFKVVGADDSDDVSMVPASESDADRLLYSLEPAGRLAAPSAAAPAAEEVRNQALEEAAAACEAKRVHVHKWHPSSSGDEAYNAACEDCAAAIRSKVGSPTTNNLDSQHGSNP